MAERLNLLASKILAPDTVDGPEPLLIVLGKESGEAVIGWIVNSRSQLKGALDQVGSQLAEGVAQSILQVTHQVESFPENSEVEVETFDEGMAQFALSKVRH
jgi:hypothetical protein